MRLLLYSSTFDTPFNLSYESLDGRDARKALNNLFTTDPKLYAEIVLTGSHTPFVDLAVDEPTLNEEDDSDEASPTAVEAAHQLLSARDAREDSRPTSVLENVGS
ncbi:hypothetical protein RhiJN_22552 [Ceratobasidium sp. AG-Ba]|nr:hypothetical protein RhiJN_22552 [Ceratobasidium sp. AG-Ba]